ncbi:DoxX family protein [bacterium]|nr:DoxX family protein [bacterium]
MNTALWIVQGLLAAMFLMAGLMKLANSKEELKPKMGDWVDAVSTPGFKLIGLLELLGAVGVVLPMAIDVLPILTPVAAIGLVMTMLGAMGLHIQRKEYDAIKKNVPLLLLALFVAVGRLIIIPIS